MREIPAGIMQRLRFLALTGQDWTRRAWKPPKDAIQVRAARLLRCSKRTVAGWESTGAGVVQGYAYVGLAFRLGGAERAQEALDALSQVDGIEGIKVKR